MLKRRDVITIDGPSGAGKSTVAKALSIRMGYRYLDTGAIYRAVTLAFLRAGIRVDPIDTKKAADLLPGIRLSLDEKGAVALDGKKIESSLRGEQVTGAVSAVASLKIVRTHLVGLQRRFAEGGKVVAEGRDLGNVVFPDAGFKFYLDADAGERAQRRARQQDMGTHDNISLQKVFNDQKRRDRIDSERDLSPLVLSEDMIRIDSTGMIVDEVVGCMLSLIKGEASGKRQ